MQMTSKLTDRVKAPKLQIRFHGVFKALFWMKGWLLVRGMLLLSHSITQGSQVTPLLYCYVALLRSGLWRHSSCSLHSNTAVAQTFNFVSSALYFFTYYFFPLTVNNKGSFKKQQHMLNEYDSLFWTITFLLSLFILR